MLIAVAAILLGFIILIWSADLFVEGAASIAHNMGMSPIIILSLIHISEPTRLRRKSRMPSSA